LVNPGALVFEGAGRLDQRDAFGPTSPRGTLRVVDGDLSWQPAGWGAPVWLVATGDVIGGASGALDAFVAALRSGGAVIVGDPASRWSRPGPGGLGVLWPF
jgi:hypothetical protein